MSNVLMIRHLPSGLSFKDKERLLQHFGADKVWEVSSKHNYLFASFANNELAETSLKRLHQLEIGNRRLIVEYSFAKEHSLPKKEDTENSSLVAKHIKEFLSALNAWNTSIEFYQPPPVHLSFKYPELNPQIAINIMYSMFCHKPFYIQILHLMNKMCLEIPFKENEASLNFFKDIFRDYFKDDILLIPPPPSETESEISSDEIEPQKKVSLPKILKRKHTLPVTRKRPATILSTASLPKVNKTKVTQDEVFDCALIQEPKKISLVVSQDALQKPGDEMEVIGELGKFEKEKQPVIVNEVIEEPEQPTITKRELLRNRISYADMKILPVFKNYHPGQPSMRLYIKNLAKTVTEQDVKRIYKRYIENISEDESIGFDVRVMQEGKMKGQAFVTFPSVAIAELALKETNGYKLKEKPMIVQFARAANKKNIE